MANSSMKKFGEKLYTLRMKNSLSQRQLAQAIDVDHRHIGRMEQNVTLPSAIMVLKIAEFFDVTPNQLMLDDVDLE
jgi:transcriptional regulator with XRE-family HTH domain